MSRISLDYQSHWITVFDGTEEAVEEAVPQQVRSEPMPDEPLVRIIRAKHCRTMPQLMNEFAAVLQFPSYFGYNWDALEECIQDLWWMKAKAYLLVITEFNKLLEDDIEGRITLIEILKKASENWSRAKGWPMSEFMAGQSVAFHCVLQLEGGKDKLTPGVQRLL